MTLTTMNSKRSSTGSTFLIDKGKLKNYYLFITGFILVHVAVIWWLGLDRIQYHTSDDAVRLYSIDDGPCLSTREWSCEGDKACRKLAEVIYFEGRGESRVGQRAIGYVVLNRKNSPHFPSTVTDVVNHGCAFEYWCKGIYNKGIQEREAWDSALEVAENVYKRKVPDPTYGANHFLNVKKISRLPRWAREYQQTAKIGNHTFYKRG